MNNIQNIFDTIIPQLQENGWGDAFGAIDTGLSSIQNYLKFIANTAGSTIKLNQEGTWSGTWPIETSTDGDTWSSYTLGTTITLTNVGDYVCFRGQKDSISQTSSNYRKFVMNGSISASGDVTSLLDGVGGERDLTPYGAYTFFCMFQGCAPLTTAPSLSATTLTPECYRGMFQSCTGLTSAPSLPATTLTTGCYRAMFYECSSLTSAPSLSATSLAENCYMYMFWGCTDLAGDIYISGVHAYSYSSNMFTNAGTTTGAGGVIHIDSTDGEDGYHWVHPSNVDLSNWTILNDSFEQFCMTSVGASTVSFVQQGGWTGTWPIKYSKNGSVWTIYSLGTDITLADGDTLRWYGMMQRNSPQVDDKYRHFIISGNEQNNGNVTFSGNIMSLYLGSGEYNSLASYGEYTCYRMFAGCTGLTTAPSLPATTLAEYCYNRMFDGCTSLVSAPSLPATTLAIHCYDGMFYGCSSLFSVSKLPATTLAEQCYNGMFYGCTSLTSAPVLSATTLADSCCASMFYGCTSLTSAPVLSATTLATGCYTSMFQGCIALTTAPSLPATTLAANCYTELFSGCTNLTGPVHIEATSPYQSGTTTTACSYMFYNSGTTTGAGGVINVGGSDSATWSSNANIDTAKWTVVQMQYFKMTASEATIVSLDQVGTYAGTWPIETSTDGNTWTSYTLGSEFQLTFGQTLYWRGTKDSISQSPSVYRTFDIRGDVDFDGSIMSLLDEYGTTTSLEPYGRYTFYKLFAGCTMDTMPNLNRILTLTTSCYESMFEGCENLNPNPSLVELPATTLADNCYYAMFKNCTTMTDALTLPAHTLVDGCYAYMFQGCSSLESIHIAAGDISAPNCTFYWVDGVREDDGEFFAPSELIWTRGIHGIPANWEWRQLLLLNEEEGEESPIDLVEPEDVEPSVPDDVVPDDAEPEEIEPNDVEPSVPEDIEPAEVTE